MLFVLGFTEESSALWPGSYKMTPPTSISYRDAHGALWYFAENKKQVGADAFFHKGFYKQ